MITALQRNPLAKITGDNFIRTSQQTSAQQHKDCHFFTSNLILSRVATPDMDGKKPQVCVSNIKPEDMVTSPAECNNMLQIYGVLVGRILAERIPAFKCMSLHPVQGLGVELDNMAFNYVSDTPPWELERPNIILELAASRKSDTPPITYHDQYLTIRNRFPRHIPFYTDGSKDAERVSVAAVLINQGYGHRIQDHSSIFTAEACAILLALECIEHSNRKRFLIFTDSMS